MELFGFDILVADLAANNATDWNIMDSMGIAAAAAADEDNVSITADESTTADARVEDGEEAHPHPTGGIQFSIAGGPDGSGAGGIRNIIRFFNPTVLRRHPLPIPPSLPARLPRQRRRYRWWRFAKCQLRRLSILQCVDGWDRY